MHAHDYVNLFCHVIRARSYSNFQFSGDPPSCQKHFTQRLELTFQALNILIAEYLMRLVTKLISIITQICEETSSIRTAAIGLQPVVYTQYVFFYVFKIHKVRFIYFLISSLVFSCQEFSYTLSVFISEIPLANMVFSFAKTLMKKVENDDSQPRFKDSDVWCILNYLGKHSFYLLPNFLFNKIPFMNSLE